MSKHKKSVPPFVGKECAPKKTPFCDPRFAESLDSKPVWRIGTMEVDGPYSWRAMKGAHFFEKVLSRIRGFETMKIREILGSHSHDVHVKEISGQAQARLRSLRLDDIEQLLSLRIEARERMWCIRRGHVLSVLWWDPEHQVCPSSKK